MPHAFRSISFAALALAFVAGAPAPGNAQSSNPRPLISSDVDDSRLVRLSGNTRPEVSFESDRGPVDDDLFVGHLLLQLRRDPETDEALNQYMSEQQDKNSANYHHWLSAEEFGEKFGASPADIAAVTRWLTSKGFEINVVYSGGTVIDFSGTAGQLREAFQTELHNLDVHGVRHVANIRDPQIPAALAPAVVGIASLHDFLPRTMYKARPNYTAASGSLLAVVPADLATIYNLNPLFKAGYSGKGQTIVVIEDTNVYSTADWSTFRSAFGLSTYTTGTFTQVHPAPPSGASNCANPGVNANDGEAILDAEYATAAAPSATIELASCADTQTTFGGLIAVQNIINAKGTPPAIISISYGECEAYNGAAANATYNAAFKQAAAEGVSIFVSSGDEGAASCDADAAKATHGINVSGFASTPYNVAVGGTDFGDTYAGSTSTYWNTTNTATYGSAKSYIPEIPWNDSCAGSLLSSYQGHSATYGSGGFCNSTTGEDYFLTTASGSGGPSGCATGAASTSGVVSGTCKGYAKPTWQSLVGVPADGVRDIPDISLFAANGLWGHYYVFCYSDPKNGGAPCTGAPSGWSGAGGTSFASPIMAAIQALVDEKWGRQGNPAPVYYKIAAAEYGKIGSASCNSSLGKTVGTSCTFYDVTQGDMDVNCTGTHNCYTPSGANGVLSTSSSSFQKSYGTTTGWDFATGIGTVNAYNLVFNAVW
jgi:subtilase family serine protease